MRRLDLFVPLLSRNSDGMIKGTPIFMANDVIHPRGENHMLAISHWVKWSDVPYEGRSLIFPRIRKAAMIDSSKYGDDAERTAWNEFYERDIELLSWLVKPRGSQRPQDSFKHGAVHDAESVFFLCVLFFNRLWPRDKTVTVEEKERLRASRGELFESLFRKRVGDVNTCAFLHEWDLLRDGLYNEEEFESLYDMLDSINAYLGIPWYNVAEVGQGQRFEFHLHDFMQRLLLREIQKLRNSGDPIHLEINPLPVAMDIRASWKGFRTSSIYAPPGSSVSIWPVGHVVYS